MILNKGKIIIIGVVVLIVFFAVLAFTGIIPGIVKKSGPSDPNLPTGPTTLEFWGVGDDQAYFTDSFKAYQAQVPNVKINYTRFPTVDEYEKALVNALAEKKGPDVFMIHSSWAYKHAGKIIPSPSTLVSLQTFKQYFPQVVVDDFTSGGQVLALPLYLDSLSLIYNKDIFNSKAVVYPPKDLNELVADVSKIREVDANKNIKLSALALGGSKNVNNLSDILSALSFQAGSKIQKDVSSGVAVSFDKGVAEALNFYTQFSSSYNPYYTWNDGFENSLNAFASGKTAMVFDYYESVKKIKEKNPFINLAVSSLPQLNISKPANVANYFGVTVSKQSPNAYVAWHFIRSLTMDKNVNSLYLQKSNRLPALLSLINAGLGGEADSFLRSFLVAKTWIKPDNFIVEKIFQNMVGDILSGKLEQATALRSAENEINNLY